MILLDDGVNEEQADGSVIRHAEILVDEDDVTPLECQIGINSIIVGWFGQQGADFNQVFTTTPLMLEDQAYIGKVSRLSKDEFIASTTKRILKELDINVS